MPLKEFELLEVLMRNAGRVLTRGQLIDRVGSDYFGDTKTLDVHIKRIRSRIEENPSEPVMLSPCAGSGTASRAERAPARPPDRRIRGSRARRVSRPGSRWPSGRLDAGATGSWRVGPAGRSDQRGVVGRVPSSTGTRT
jgi:hypothetical protein